AVRGEYGGGKTFFARWLQERAMGRGFAAAEVQISESDTPLHRLETVYRRLMERLAVSGCRTGALRVIIDAWFYTLEEDILADPDVDAGDERALMARTEALMERRLAEAARRAPAFGAALRGYRRALLANDMESAEGLISWLGGQPHVAAGVKKKAGVKGDVDHFAALNFLRGLLLILKDSGHPGLILVLDEVETLQRVRGDVRDKGLNSLRQLIDEIDAGRFPGLYILITGTSAFFDGPRGVQRLAPLAQRLHTDFSTDPRFDNPRAVQIRLRGFDLERLVHLGSRIRDIYAEGSENETRLKTLADDRYVEILARAVAGELGGKVGVAPRLFLKKLVGDVLDRIDQFPDFNPRKDYALTLADSEMREIERNARAARDVDDVELEF
ncbi:MAG: BREX system ATP-binding protein BrxD, partial [Desulfobacterales bacterium]|nr:BREX system ATP-binding protein BrxD [Desulfobacterales bacterium]